MEPEGRPKHGQRRRCSDPTGKGCKGFARRNSVPPLCTHCGGGTRAATQHTVDADTGEPTRRARGLVAIPPRIQALLDGTLPVEELDEEELARGYPRASDGSFRNPPVVIPRAVYARLQRELFDRAGRELRENLVSAAETMTSIMLNPEIDAKVRMDAAKWLTERVMGKTPDVTVNVDEKRYEKLFERLERGASVDNVVEAEVVVTDGREP